VALQLTDSSINFLLQNERFEASRERRYSAGSDRSVPKVFAISGLPVLTIAGIGLRAYSEAPVTKED
jgi:hypothetical protein